MTETPVIDIRTLTKRFGKRTVVDDISFTVGAGEVYGFLGPNGAGKSTTIRMLVNLVRPHQGEIFLFGRSIQNEGNKVLSPVGALIESPDFYKHLSARRNLELLAQMQTVPASRIDEVLDIVGLTDRAADKVKAYSQGMKQRLGIAQALLSRPQLLILDEPTNGLDPQGMKEIRDLIRQLSGEGMTIFLSSHLLDEVERVCSSMAILNRGKMVTSGSVSDLLGAGGEVRVECQVDNVTRATEILQAQDYVREVKTQRGILSVTLPSDKTADANRILVEAGIAVVAFTPRTSLEDYFLSITHEAELTGAKSTPKAEKVDG